MHFDLLHAADMRRVVDLTWRGTDRKAKLVRRYGEAATESGHQPAIVHVREPSNSPRCSRRPARDRWSYWLDSTASSRGAPLQQLRRRLVPCVPD